ncbi:glycosyltransferase family 2 protein [Pantoea osteomyelitidis]|uniref:Glycosyltransferase family 2 protein n=1 Tax=Pantoea osteomyelitidis TaxID=3230026 RepID=A0ABW7PUN1_9GAMM
MSEKILSVIIPAYNVEKYIVECVDSLLKQISAPNEIIIINDGSTDGTLPLAEKHYAHLPQVNIITIPNGGLGNARDTGMAVAEGDYIFFCDPDDRVAEGLFDELQTVVKNYPEVDLFCFNSCTFEDGDSQRTQPKVRHDGLGLQAPQQVFASLLRNGSYTSAVWNYVLKKSVTEQHNLRFVKRLHEDHHFTLSAYLKTECAWVSDNVYYHRRVYQDSLTNSTKNNAYFISRYEIFLRDFYLLKTSGMKKSGRSEIEKYFVIHSLLLMISLSLHHRVPLPDYILNAFQYLGRNIKPQSFKEWLMLKNPKAFTRLQKLKANRKTGGSTINMKNAV